MQDEYWKDRPWVAQLMSHADNGWAGAEQPEIKESIEEIEGDAEKTAKEKQK